MLSDIKSYFRQELKDPIHMKFARTVIPFHAFIAYTVTARVLGNTAKTTGKQ